MAATLQCCLGIGVFVAADSFQFHSRFQDMIDDDNSQSAAKLGELMQTQEQLRAGLPMCPYACGKHLYQ